MLASSKADQISLRGGGRIQGEITPDPDDPNRVRVWLFNSKNPVTFQKAQILEVIPKATSLDDYLAKDATTAPDAKSQYDLGVWCEENKLTELALVHYEKAVEENRDFEPAHRKLGHVSYEGRWLTPDQVRTAQGLVKYKGKWITPEEKSLIVGDAKTTSEQASLIRQFRLLRQALIEGPVDRSRDAETRLMQIREPVAIVPLIRVFGNNIPARKKLLIQILGEIPGPEAASALVARLLLETDPDVRFAALDRLKRRDDRTIEIQLTRALRSFNVAIVNRAAWAIGHLGITSALPALIPALVSYEERSGLPNAETSGTQVAGMSDMTYYSYYPPQGALFAANNSSYAILTPPAVGPGAVAYGAVVVPYSAYLGGTAAMSTGSPPIGEYAVPGMVSEGAVIGPAPAQFSRPSRIRVENLEVHDALVKLSGRDFEYDIPAWVNWMNREFKQNQKPVKQVPQPKVK